MVSRRLSSRVRLAMFILLVSMYGHGMGSSPMKEFNGDLLDLCTAGSHTEEDAMKCIAKGHSIKDYGAKREYITQVANGLKRCPYLTCVISTPGDPVVAPGFTVRYAGFICAGCVQHASLCACAACVRVCHTRACVSVSCQCLCLCL